MTPDDKILKLAGFKNCSLNKLDTEFIGTCLYLYPN